MSEARLSSHFYIQVDGTDLRHDVVSQVMEVTVDQHVHLPDMFVIRITDPDLTFLDEGPFDLTKKVKISADNETDEQFVLMEGEITALEPNFGVGMNAELVVRGYDKSHRLFRESKSIAHVNKKDSDLASEIAGNAGLSSDIETTSIVYDHIFQDNQSDLAFLMQRAWRIGFECFVSEGKLTFRKPPSDSAEVNMTWGQDLQYFTPRMTLSEQVDEVMVRGWDVDKLEAIVGQASSSDGRLFPEIEESKNGARWASDFGSGKLIIVDQPVVNQSEANELAKARYNELSGAFVEAEGMAFRRPDIRAGKMVKLDGLGNRFSGKYLVSSATHTYSPNGLETTFSVRGSRNGTLTDQAIGADKPQRWVGVVPAIVTNSDDPSAWGRIKVKYPWMTEDGESDWARVMGNGAGPDCGLHFIPEVGDEVLVAFEHGDFSRPFVIGGLWNGQHALPPEAPSGGEQPKVQIWKSRTGHTIATYDTSDNKIEIITAGGHTLLFDDANSKIELVTSGGNSVIMDDNGRKISIESSGDVEVKASMNMKLEAGANLDIKASGQVNIKGTMVNLN